MNITEMQELNKIYNRNEILFEGIKKLHDKATEIAERNCDFYGLKDITTLMKDVCDKLEKTAIK